MLLDKEILEQLRAIFKMLETPVEFHLFAAPGTQREKETEEFLSQLCSTSELLSYTKVAADADAGEFSIFHGGEPTRITFRGIPGGHEFNSLLLAILNADGKGKNMPDEALRRRIQALKGPIALRTFVSLSCTNCPDVVQALNQVALLNPGVTNTVIDGGAFPEQAKKEGIQAVPTVLASGKIVSVGRASMPDLLSKLEKEFGTVERKDDEPLPVKHFDVLVLGGGPAGVAAGIYAARKGLKVGLVSNTSGGSVTLTGAIDNLITTRSTTGAALGVELTGNAAFYGVQMFENRNVNHLDLQASPKLLSVDGGETFSGDTLIIATGSSPRRLNIPGEDRYVGKGVAFCPHCDGPYFKGKDVAVIGGGNSGMEAAIDLAGICRHVTLLEFLPELKADEVLIEAARRLPNVEMHTSRQVTEVVGDGSKVTALKVKDRDSGDIKELPIDGVFVQIGTVPGSDLVKGKVELNRAGEITVDRFMRTSVAGVYAAGDVTDGPYKQIVTAIGEGATAAMAAFADRVRAQVKSREDAGKADGPAAP